MHRSLDRDRTRTQRVSEAAHFEQCLFLIREIGLVKRTHSDFFIFEDGVARPFRRAFYLGVGTTIGVQEARQTTDGRATDHPQLVGPAFRRTSAREDVD
ncbi:MAG: hypothetical protein ACLQIQ_16745 [Beijerinckiaceae bacterium]|uniref:hypothetical protein n=1 Tax=Roseiarcus sp. TaxID=1969460 RepID=UPI003F9C175F